jgi:hypothetical protein
MDEKKKELIKMLMDRWADAGPSLGGWGINNAYFKKNSSPSNDTTSRPVTLNLETGKTQAMKKGGAVKSSSASKRADGCCTKGKTKGKMC